LRLANSILAAAMGLILATFSGVPADVRADTQLGDSAVVLGTGGSGVRIRAGPGMGHETLGVLSEGTRVGVLNGPRSDGQTNWYQVERSDGAGARLRGWAAGTYLSPANHTSARQGGSRGTRSFFAKVMGYASGGSIGYQTATGTRVRWGTVSVDPRYIALGSLMTIEGLEGVFAAEDTGPAIKGAMVDVWFPDKASAVRWGTQQRTVTVLREGY
jgi:3D (Asp-Asp-Asp) domain-containing protein